MSVHPFQSASAILMLRPANFGFNPQTALDNAFQQPDQAQVADLQPLALSEFDHFVHRLQHAGVEVCVLPDTPQPIKPDAIFPNNWFSVHEDGTLVLYPMKAPNRRLERRADIAEQVGRYTPVERVIDLTAHEQEGRFLEGTGSMIFDHLHGYCYACLSPRTDQALLEELCARIGYKPVVFEAWDAAGDPIYHTNVMLSIGTHTAVICTEALAVPEEREHVLQLLRNSGRTLVEVTLEQMQSFCCNVLEVRAADGRHLLTMSERAFKAFTPAQRDQLGVHAELLHVPLYTIEEAGGGGSRCMMAEIGWR